MANAFANLTRSLRQPATGSTRARVVEPDGAQDPQRFSLPWWLAAGGAALLTALIGWLFWVALAFLAWTITPQIDPVITLHIASQGWLLSHGIAVGLPGATLSIVPLGMTALIVLLGTGFCNWAATKIRPNDEQSALRSTIWASAVFAGSYLIVLLAVRQWSDPGIGFNPLLSILIAAGVPLFSFGRVNHWRPLDLIPQRLRWLLGALPALGAALGVMLVAGMAALIWAVISGWGRIRELHDSLLPGVAGSVVLVVLQLLYLPNFLLWATSWVSGAGIQLGYGSVISPARTDVGLLPAVPIFGALPPAGPQPDAMAWWAASTLLAGGVAAWLLLRSVRRDVAAWPTFVIPERSERRVLDPMRAAILGALVGIIAGLLLVVCQWFARGDLGNIRLVDLGARLGPVAIMASTGMGIGGMFTASIIAWWAARKMTNDWQQGAGDAGGDELAEPVDAQLEPEAADQEIGDQVVSD